MDDDYADDSYYSVDDDYTDEDDEVAVVGIDDEVTGGVSGDGDEELDVTDALGDFVGLHVVDEHGEEVDESPVDVVGVPDSDEE